MSEYWCTASLNMEMGFEVSASSKGNAEAIAEDRILEEFEDSKSEYINILCEKL